MPDNHQKFLARLEASRKDVQLVGSWLSTMGFTYQMSPTYSAENREDWKEFIDSGDLFLIERCEVKRLSVVFTSRYDWPFGEKFIVCGKNSFDRARPKPAYYFILSSDYKSVAIVDVKQTRHSWYVETRMDSTYQEAQECYFCPLDKITFTKFIKEQQE